MDRRSFSERLFRLFSLFFCLLSFPPLGSFPFPMPVFPRLLSMRILFRADSFPCFYSSVFVRFCVSRFRFPPPACSVPNNPSSCLAVRFPPRTARNDDADCSGGAGHACGGIGRPCGTGEPAGASSAVGTETSRRGGFRASVRGADTGRPSRVRSIRLPVAAGTAEAVRHGAVSTAQGCSVSFFTL